MALLAGACDETEVARGQALDLIKAVQMERARSVEILGFPDSNDPSKDSVEQKTDPNDPSKGSVELNTMEDPVSSLRTLLNSPAFVEHAMPEIYADLAVLSTGIWSPPQITVPSGDRWGSPAGRSRPPNPENLKKQLPLLKKLLDIQARVLREEIDCQEALDERKDAWSDHGYDLAD